MSSDKYAVISAPKINRSFKTRISMSIVEKLGLQIQGNSVWLLTGNLLMHIMENDTATWNFIKQVGETDYEFQSEDLQK